MQVNEETAYTAYLAGDLESSKAACEALLAKNSKNHVVSQLLPIVLFKLNETDLALKKMQAIVNAAPNQAESHYSLSLMQLWYGDFSNGWRSYEWRLKIKSFNIPLLSKTRWQGEAIANKTILVLCEQGYGDCIQFFRYLRLVKQRCKSLVLVCYPPLRPLFAGAPFIDELIETVNTDTNYDCYTSIASLPGIFAANESNIPDVYASQFQNNNFVAAGINEIDARHFNIGIAWSGRPKHENDQFRSLSLDFFLPLTTDSRVRLVTLQPHKILDLSENAGVIQAGRSIKDFGNTANIINLVDLVITIDSSVAHLALSMHKKTIVLLPTPREWRWVEYNNVSPWYPDAILIAQKQPGDWVSVNDKMMAMVNQLLENF